MKPLIFLALLGGCAASNLEGGHKLGEFEAFTEAVETLTTHHVAAVGSATSLDTVAVLEAEYTENWAFLHDELVSIQAEIGDCDLMDGMQPHLDVTGATIEAMHAEMSAHATAQAAQTEVSACIALESTHETTMTGQIDACLEAHEAMHDGVTCAGEHMGGM